MRFFALLTLVGLALFPAFTQTTKPKKTDRPKTVKKAAPGQTTTAAKPKPTPKKPTSATTTGKTTASSKPKAKAGNPSHATAATAKPKPKIPVTTVKRPAVIKTTANTAKPTGPKSSQTAAAHTASPKPKAPATNTTGLHATQSARPKPGATPLSKPDENTEWEKVSNVTDTTTRITALRKFNEAFPKSDKRASALELIAATRGQIGNEKMVAGDLSGAVAYFKLAAAEAPKPMSDQLFGESLSKFPANLFFRGAREAAYEIAKTLEERAETNVGQMLGVASFYMSVENGAEAKRVAENAIKLNADSSPAWQTLGLANRMDFLLDESAAAYAKALTIEPDSLSARRGLAEMKRSMGKADEAVTLYREILVRDEANLPAQTGVILALFDAEKRGEAEMELARSLEANPGNVILLAGVAYWYAAHNEGGKAVEFANKAITAEPRFIWSHIALARGLVAQKKPTEAEKVLLAARAYGEFPTLEYETASARLAAGFYREAAEELGKSFTVKNGVVSTKLGGRVQRESKSFTELVGPERRASIFAPTAADDPENAARLGALLELKQQLDAAEPKADALATVADAFIRGDDRMKVHRQIFVASQMLDKKIALPKVVEISKSAVASIDAGLDVPNAAAAVLASELYESRAIAGARGEYVTVPDVSRSTLSAILRGRVEEINGWALYEMDNPVESVLRLRRAVSVLPVDSAWWRSGMWRLGSALALSGKDAEALDVYIKCYKSGTADVVRYGVIESLYKRVNGNTEGLEARIGARPTSNAPIAKKIEPKPTPETKAEPSAERKTDPVPATTPEIKADASKAEIVPAEVPVQKTEPKPTPEAKAANPADTKTEPSANIVPTVSVYNPNPPSIPVEPAAQKTEPTPTPEPTPVKTASQKAEPKPTPELKTETPVEIKTPPITTAAPSPTVAEVKINAPKTDATPTATPETKTDQLKPTPEPTPDRQKTNLEKPNETVAQNKPPSGNNEIFPPVVIKIPSPETNKPPINENAVKSGGPPVTPDTKPAEPKPDSTTPDTKTVNPAPTAESRPRIVDPIPAPASEVKPCTLAASDEIVSLKKGGSDMAVIIGLDDDGELDGLTATANSPKNISVTRKLIEGVTTRAIFVVKSISPNTGMYQIKFEMPCGKKEVLVRVR